MRRTEAGIPERVLKEKIYRMWLDQPLARKLIMATIFTAVTLFVCNLVMYSQINSMIRRINSVYSSNVNLSELSDSLERVQTSMYRYLEIRDYSALMQYYLAEEDYRELFGQLNDMVSNSPTQVLEKNIRNMSESFLTRADAAITAKRGMNVEEYTEEYNQSMKLYHYIVNDLSDLNEQLFQNNAASYRTLQRAMQFTEISSMVILAIVIVLTTILVVQMTSNIVAPLTTLAHTAEKVGEGNLELQVAQPDNNDEIGILTRAFNTMVSSLNSYVIRVRESAEKEQEMMERELKMQTHLKEAQLRFLQAQINPHFLFNSLNAGVQLAEMEDDEKTAVFLEHMADFFRYNVKKGKSDTTLKEELESVENYIYILNVRFAGEISFSTEIDQEALHFRMPSMILQPIVENAVNHGIRGMESGGWIKLKIYYEPGEITVRVEDNGKGMSAEQIEAIYSSSLARSERDSTGIGLDNVITRLTLYYDREDILEIISNGEGTGTTIVMHLPEREA